MGKLDLKELRSHEIKKDEHLEREKGPAEVED